MSRFLLAVTLGCVAWTALSQDLPQFSIHGTVVDAVSGEPLPNVNIYLSNTTRGTTTNLEGEFVLRNVPAGLYELVSSMVGYERQVVRYRAVEEPKEGLRIRMKQIAIETQPVEVLAKDPVEWRINLETFRDYIFGNTRNGSRCVIRNPEVLDFTVEKGGRFTASARQPLLVENPELGYTLEFGLSLFEVDGALFRYGGTVLFTPLEGSPEEQAEWEEARERAYRGSLRHFCTALAMNRVAEEGFRISTMHQIPATMKGAVARERVKAENILFPGRYSFERRLVFDHFLMVEYLPESPEPGFHRFWSRQAGFGQYTEGHQISWLKLDFQDVRMNIDGNLYDPFSLKTYGYWSFERLGEWLPLEYSPG